MLDIKRNLKVAGLGIICVLILCFIVRYFYSNYVSSKRYEELKEAVVETIYDETSAEETTQVETETQTETETEPDLIVTPIETEPETKKEEDGYIDISEYLNHTPALNIDHAKLLQTNADYKGWINIPGTEISYPVPMATDNDFYLHKLFETKQYEYAGSLFIDAYSSNGIDQDNLIIYGHNMRNGTMFGRLKNFKDIDYFNKHPYIEFYTPDEVRTYLIFAVRTVPASTSSLDYALGGFNTQEYINNAIKESVNSRRINISGQIISLSTCVGDKTKRLLVSAIRIK